LMRKGGHKLKFCEGLDQIQAFTFFLCPNSKCE
jgi:hypothetical protein